MTAWTWRVWTAFESRPLPDRTEHYRGLSKSCRRADGQLDVDEYTRWVDVLVEYGHLSGDA